MSADNDNPTALEQQLRGNLEARLDALATNLADTLRSAAAGEHRAAADTLADASAELRGVISVVKHLDK